MHITLDYKDRRDPAQAAIADIRDWLGVAKFDELCPEMAKLTHCGNFAMYCALAGIQGFPVRAWYESFHGQGSWKPEQLGYLR